MASKISYKREMTSVTSSKSLQSFTMKDLLTGNNPNVVLGNRSYGKSGVKILHVSRNGPVHTVNEYEVSTRLTLASEKDYLLGDNSDIIATDSQKNTVYVLAKKFGIKSPEDFGILLCNHFLSKYSHVTKVVVQIEAMQWNRITYNEDNGQKQHNHAFVHTPTHTRTASVTWLKNEYFPTIISGLKDLRILKTTQSSFVNFVDDEYRTLPDTSDRIFSTIVDCQWEFRKVSDINFDKSFEMVKSYILHNFAGDLDKGIPSPSVQHTLYNAEKEALEKIPEIKSIEMTMPNKHYIDFDFSKFKGLELSYEKSSMVYLPLEKPSGTIYGKLDRRHSKL